MNDRGATALETEVRIGYQPGASDANNVAAYVRRNAERHPERVAFRWPDPAHVAAFGGGTDTAFATTAITYGAYDALIGRVAHGLVGLGVGKGDRVILFLPMSLAMYVSMLAIQRLGAVAVFLDSWARRNQLALCADCVEPTAMISHRAAYDAVAGVPRFDALPLRVIAGPGNDGRFAQLEDLYAGPASLPIVPVEREHTALITFTTGSSGVPKGANRTHRFLASQHEALDAVVPYAPDDVDLPAFPIFSLNNLFGGLSTTLPALDLAEPGARDAAALVSQFVHDRITCTTLSPSLLNGLSAFCLANGITLPALRRAITGGAPISRDNVRDFKAIAPAAEIWILYGSTEVEPMAHIEAGEMLHAPENPDPEIVEEGVNVGLVYDRMRYRFIRPTRAPIDLAPTSWAALEVPPGGVGEFIVAGEHVCPGYWNDAAAFRNTKIRDADGTVWHRTGDLAYLDARNYLWVVGRVHNLIDRAGRYYFPVSAEILLKRCGFVRRGAFLGLPDPRLGERTAVAIAFADGADRPAAVAEIRRLFGKNAIAVDGVYEVLDIPMDPRHHSKVEYAVLRETILRGDAVALWAGEDAP